MSVEQNLSFQKNDKEFMEHLIKKYNDDHKDKELEIVLTKLKLDKNKFIEIVRHLKKIHGNPIPSTILDITTNQKNDYRRSINGEYNISQYCKNNNFKGIKYNDIKKQRVSLNQTDYEKFLKRYAKYDDYQYNFSLNLKNEIPIDNIKDDNFINIKYRYKHRFSFKTDKFTIDLTIVKEKKNVYGDYVVFNSFREFINSNPTEHYEIEIEALKTKITFEDIENKLLLLLQIVTNKQMIMSNNDNDIIKKYYKTLIGTNTSQIIKQRIQIITALIQYLKTNDKENLDEQSKQFNKQFISELDSNEYDNEYSYFNYICNKKFSQEELIQDLTNFQEQNKKISYKLDVFKSPKPVSLTLPDTLKIQTTDYTVTDKADGVSALLLIIGKHNKLNETLYKKLFKESDDIAKFTGKVYIIDSNFNMIDTNMNVSDPQYQNTLINGEYITHSKNGDILMKPLFKAYDIYILDNKDIKQLPLYEPSDENKSRYSILKDTIININENNENSVVDIDTKVFRYGNLQTIKQFSKEIWGDFTSGKTNYKYDGLIYTPAKLPVCYNEDSLYYDNENKINNIESTWFLNLKWKPLNENTIDFYVTVSDEDKWTGNRKENPDNMPIKYKEVKLYCSQRNIPVPFQTPNHPELSVAFVPISENNKIKCEDGSIIESGNIVEFLYENWDSEHETGLRWKPLRIRHDKTYELNKILDEQQQIFDNMSEAFNIHRNKRFDFKEENLLKKSIQNLKEKNYPFFIQNTKLKILIN